jgi:hypothetical protein
MDKHFSDQFIDWQIAGRYGKTSSDKLTYRQIDGNVDINKQILTCYQAGK